jgi:predicted Fe-Mo cluster-binding NifX family protein
MTPARRLAQPGSLAVTTFQGQISPVLEEARQLLVLGPQPGHRQSLRLDRAGMASDPDVLRALGITTLICGAACRVTEAALHAAGITLTSFVAGEVEAVVRAHASGGLGADVFRLPGCAGGSRGGRACSHGRSTCAQRKVTPR